MVWRTESRQPISLCGRQLADAASPGSEQDANMRQGSGTCKRIGDPSQGASRLREHRCPIHPLPVEARIGQRWRNLRRHGSVWLRSGTGRAVDKARSGGIATHQEENRMGRIVLVLILFPTALAAVAQKDFGVRLGVGNASLAVPGHIDSDPCPPETDCPAGATDAVRGLILGADLDLPVPNSSGALGLRIGAAYAQKGGAGSGRDADGEPDRGGTLSTSYLQFSALLRARTAGPQSLVVLLSGTSCRAGSKATWRRPAGWTTPESPWAQGWRWRCPAVPVRVLAWRESTTGA